MTPKTPVGRPRGPRLIHPAKAEATTPPPLTGAWSPTDTRLDTVEKRPLPRGVGPEDVAIDADGGVLAGGDDGSIWRWPRDFVAGSGTEPDLVAETGGRPLGIEIDPRDGSVIVCDAWRGLLRLTPDGGVTELATKASGTPIVFCNNAAVARDGTVFFTDSSTRYPLSAWKKDVLEHRPNGRLLRWEPGAQQAEVVWEELYFPNGVALTPDETALLLVETSTHRLIRFPLTGTTAGDPVELADLPAYPDNMSPVGDGTFWIALPSPRLPIEERLLPHPRVRQAAALLPDRLQPQPKRYGLVAQVDANGTVLRTFHGPTGSYRMVTGVRQDGDSLWMGSLTEPAIARVRLS